MMGGHIFLGGGGFLDIAGPRPLRCACGTEFGKYMEQAVDEPFPYSATGPVDQTITNVWQGRRLRVLPPRDGPLTNVPEPREQMERRWQTGKVVKLCQWNSGPFSDRVNWNITIQFDNDDADRPESMRAPAARAMPLDLPDIDEVEHLSYRDLQQLARYLDLPSSGRMEALKTAITAVLTTKEEEGAAAIAAQAAAKGGVPVEWGVCRADVTRGGTLQPLRNSSAEYRTSQQLISFEWLDPAVPALEVQEGVTCPTCRAVVGSVTLIPTVRCAWWGKRATESGSRVPRATLRYCPRISSPVHAAHG